jgi:tRNA splicing ligase
MDALKSECWFSCELATPTSTHVRTQALEAYVTHGRATTSAVELSDGHPAVSVSFKDASQGDVKNLPCGARSLLIEADTGAIVCRGINKFFDMGEVSDGWMSEEALWREKAYRVWAVRKMAGFVVTVFSLDGLHLEVMSKHALVGPHAQAARELLAKAGGAQRAQMAADLFTWGACASFECIRRTEDYQHPVLE